MSKYVPVRPPTKLFVQVGEGDWRQEVQPIVMIRNPSGSNYYAVESVLGGENVYSFFCHVVTPYTGGPPRPAHFVPQALLDALEDYRGHHGLIDLQDDPYREPLTAAEQIMGTRGQMARPGDLVRHDLPSRE